MQEIVLQEKEQLTKNYFDAKQIEEATQDFLDSIVAAETTKVVYKKGIRYFFDYMQEKGITTFDAAAVVKYREHLISTKGANATNLYMAALKRLIKFLQKRGQATNIDIDELRSVKISKGNKRDSLTIKQTKELLSLDLTPRDRAILTLFITGGLREIELVRADIKDITNNGNNHILLVQGKGEETKNNFIVLTDTAYKVINDYLATRKGAKSTDALFTSESKRNNNGRLSTSAVRHLVKDKLRAIGIDTPRISTHSLRHTAINLILDNGAELLEAQQFARHKSPTTTQQNYIDARITAKAKTKSADIIESILQGG